MRLLFLRHSLSINCWNWLRTATRANNFSPIPNCILCNVPKFLCSSPFTRLIVNDPRTDDTDQNSPVKVKFARVECLVNPLTMGGQNSPYFFRSTSPVVIT
ncbi:hypothetical protein ACN38_g7227 [Penicillium nordicum]|uniref:Uncharacterized protein n=1 Tax=Penicillium nordicum TaxID=229535 RepID=A0A0M8P5T1_9EURO|nr:hypothetical protein ACN38_g7227 [Penicillium nordicum]